MTIEALAKARQVLRVGKWRLRRLQGVVWDVWAAWVREAKDGTAEAWAELWCPEFGSFLLRLDDETETLHHLPRNATRELQRATHQAATPCAATTT